MFIFEPRYLYVNVIKMIYSPDVIMSFISLITLDKEILNTTAMKYIKNGNYDPQ